MKLICPRFFALLVSVGCAQLHNYDPDKGYRSVQFASAAYCPQTTIQDWSCGPCRAIQQPTQVQVVTDDRLQLQAYVARMEDAVVVSFRGTVPSKLHNWLVDLDSVRTPYPPSHPDSRVHTGFLAGYASLRPGIAAFVGNHTDAKRLLVTGHSLGGAMATLCFVDMLSDFPGFEYELHTFGSPRVGNAQFADLVSALNGSAWRVVHNRDVVSQIPFRFMGFEHAGEEVWYRADGDFRECGAGENPECSWGNRWLSVTDHFTYLGVGVSKQC